MAVARNDELSRLQLRFHTGTTEEGKPIYKLKSYSNVKADAADEDVFRVAEALGELQEHVLQNVIRHDSAVLISDEI
ncbi:MAG: DUF1659 domain-containing protein [Firmicutes bacterium]|nr:DUF1659 domain-containing protein [Bacillota bacterium]